MIGLVKSVKDERLGGEVTGIVGGGFAIILDDTTDFDEDGGTFILPFGGTRDYRTVSYDDGNMTGAIGDSSFADGIAVGDWIAPWSATQEDTRRVAEIDVDGEGPVLAVVPHALRPLMQPGLREPGAAEVVSIRVRDLEVVVEDLHSKTPGIVGSSISVPGVGDDANFSVDADGHLVAKTARIEPGEDGDVPLVIQDTFGTGTAWTNWKDELGNIQSRVDNGGAFRSLAGFVGVDAIGATWGTVALLPAVGGVFWGSGSADYDAALKRTGAQELTLDGNGAAAQLRWGGGAGNGYSRLAANDYVELAERNTDPGAGPAGTVRIYSKVVAGTSKLFAQDDAGVVHPLW